MSSPLNSDPDSVVFKPLWSNSDPDSDVFKHLWSMTTISQVSRPDSISILNEAAPQPRPQQCQNSTNKSVNKDKIKKSKSKLKNVSEKQRIDYIKATRNDQNKNSISFSKNITTQIRKCA